MTFQMTRIITGPAEEPTRLVGFGDYLIMGVHLLFGIVRMALK